MKLKGIIEYILRTGLFLLLNRQFAYMSLFTFIANLLPRNNIIKDDWAIFGLMFICLTITCSYLIAKICGIFKKLDKLNIVSGFVVICILNYILNISLNCSIQIIPIRISYIPDDNFWYFYPFLFCHSAPRRKTSYRQYGQPQPILFGTQRDDGIFIGRRLCGDESGNEREHNAYQHHDERGGKRQRRNARNARKRLNDDIDEQRNDVRERDADDARRQADDECFGIEQVADVLFSCAQRAQNADLLDTLDDGDVGDDPDHDAGYDQRNGSERHQYIGDDIQYLLHHAHQQPHRIGISDLNGGVLLVHVVPGVEVVDHGGLAVEIACVQRNGRNGVIAADQTDHRFGGKRRVELRKQRAQHFEDGAALAAHKERKLRFDVVVLIQIFGGRKVNAHRLAVDRDGLTRQRVFQLDKRLLTDPL